MPLALSPLGWKVYIHEVAHEYTWTVNANIVDNPWQKEKIRK